MNDPYQKLNIRNRYNLSALWFEKFSDNIKNNNRLIIFCHGFTGTKEGGGKAIQMSEYLLSEGYDSLLFDFRGCGESEGCWDDLTLTSQIEDLSNVVDWGIKQGYSEFLISGRSFGGTTAICYAPSNKRVVAVSTWAAVARPVKLFSSYLVTKGIKNINGYIDFCSNEGQVRIKKQFLEDLKKHDIGDYASRIREKSFLVIHGSEDKDVPPEEAMLIWQAVQGPKQIEIIEGADHRFTEHRYKLWSTFRVWLQNIDW